MPRVKEFKNVNDLNQYLNENVMLTRWEVVPVVRMFENPANNKMTSCMTYVLIMN